MATSGNSRNSPKEGKRTTNISLKGCTNIQLGNFNSMHIGGESNTSQKHTASNNTRSATRSHESETNQTYQSSTESLSETRSEMMANEEIPEGRTDSGAIDSNYDAALSADNTPNSGNNNNFSHTFKTRCTLQQGVEKYTEKGALLRKKEDTSYSYQEGELIYNHEKLSKRIGCIKVTCFGEIQGTGFRVGSKYFMTAFHVIEDALTQFWKEVYRRLTVKERMQMEWTEDKIPVDGAWTLSKLWNEEKRNELIEIGEQYITKRVEIKFGFVNDNDRIILGQCSYEVAFASPSHDVVILELIEDTNLTNPFHLIKYNAAATKLHLIGHPGGKKLTHDPACTIMKDQEELDKLIKRGISFFTKLGLPKDQVEKDYEPCVLSPDHLLFHCSESISHGASGSPLIVIIEEKKAQVIGMLLRGHPKFYYNFDKVKGDRPDLLVESGISMEKVRSLLNRHSLEEFAEHLFHEQF